ncbi:hypothetical protein SMC26_08060 [Actinomadura fulvescens]|uniref:Uncharacterized protein n=1 Tax=Actinomadura fulvescens TaxID=46160 RepID=A0ABN3QX05_9ACTN
MADDAWAQVVRKQITGIASFLDITRDGLDLMGPDDERAARVHQAHAAFEWMAKVFDNAPPLNPGGGNELDSTELDGAGSHDAGSHGAWADGEET